MSVFWLWRTYFMLSLLPIWAISLVKTLLNCMFENLFKYYKYSFFYNWLKVLRLMTKTKVFRFKPLVKFSVVLRFFTRKFFIGPLTQTEKHKNNKRLQICYIFRPSYKFVIIFNSQSNRVVFCKRSNFSQNLCPRCIFPNSFKYVLKL